MIKHGQHWTGQHWTYLATIVIFLLVCTRDEDANRLNIIYIMTDQQAFDGMSCAGNELVHTPCMDQLAAV